MTAGDADAIVAVVLAEDFAALDEDRAYELARAEARGGCTPEVRTAARLRLLDHERRTKGK